MVERRRQDDLVDAAGVPWSEAHQALWYKFVEEMAHTRDELVEAHRQMVQDHETTRHHPGFKDMFPDRNPEDVVLEVVSAAATISAFREDFDMLADKALGTRKTTFEGGGREDDGWDHKIQDLYAKLGNGSKLKVGVDWKDRAAVLIALTAMALKIYGVF